MPDIVVDTYKLEQYAQRLKHANARIVKLDYRMDLLYGRVGLLGLSKLIQADALTGYSWRIVRCASYLEQTAYAFNALEKELLSENPLDFRKSPLAVRKKTIYDVGVAIKKGADKVRGYAERLVNSAIDSYSSHGTVYKVVQYGKAVLKGAKGVVKIAAGVASLLGSGGLSTPVSILSIISGGNDFYNAIMDIGYTYTGDYESAGKTNALKDYLTKSASEIGQAFGHEKIGAAVGKITYYGIDLVSSLAALDYSMDKIKQLSPTNLKDLGGELKEIANIDVSGIFTTDVEMLKYQTKLAGYTYTATKNAITNIGALIGVGESAVGVGKSIDKIITVNYSDWENPVLDFFETVSDVKDAVGKAIKASAKATEFIFE